jgi:hypothetical protein
MTYLYDVINTSNHGMWVAAEDKVDAAVIAHDLKHTKEIENARVEGPLKVSPQLQSILNEGRRGQLGYKMNPPISPFLSGNSTPPHDPWFFIKEFDRATESSDASGN